MSPQVASSAVASSVASVQSADGTLLAVAPSGFVGELAGGDPVADGEILVTGADSGASLVLAGGVTLTMAENSRVAIHGIQGSTSPDSVAARVVVITGAFFLDVPASADGPAAAWVETGSAALVVEKAAVAFSYQVWSGLRATLVRVADDGGGAVRVFNEAGSRLLNPAEPEVTVASWSEAPRPLSAGDANSHGLPEWTAVVAPLDPSPDGDLPLVMALQAEAGPVDVETLDAVDIVEPAEAAAGATELAATGEPSDDEAPSFETGAGMAEPGDISFVFPDSPARGLADHQASSLTAGAAPPGALQPGMPVAAASWASPAQRALSPAAPDHGLDILVPSSAPAAELQPPPPPPPAGPPQLHGWEPTGRAWDYAGSVSLSYGGPEWPINLDRPADMIVPREGESMAALAPFEVWPATLEVFLGLPDRALKTLVDGVTAVDGSAMRTSMTLKAGQTLVFDVLFDALDSPPANDFAAFTVSNGHHGEAYVISSVEAIGSNGATPWQTLAYTAGAAGRYTLGFVVINDFLQEGKSTLYVDGLRAGFDDRELALVTSGDDAFGGHLDLYEPDPPPDPILGELLTGFEGIIAGGDRVGRIDVVAQFAEPDGARGQFEAPEGETMAVLHAYGSTRPIIEDFLGLQTPPGARFPMPIDIDGSLPAFGSATRLGVTVVAGDQLSFEWLFDAGDALPENDFAVFTVADENGSDVFKLSDVRTVGDGGASGWRTSVYTAAEDGELTIGFAVLNDRNAGFYSDPENSRLLVDNVRLNRDFTDGYQIADLPDPGHLATLPVG